jgi:hypothetical protein
VNDVTFFDDPQLDTAVGLIFDLASQLHIERQRRTALETALVRKELVSRKELDALSDDRAFLDQSRQSLDESLARLMQIMTESGPPQHPLRAEATDERSA